MRDETKTQIEQWRAETEAKPLQSARHVQDRLLDLYGALRAYPVVDHIEQWLALTRERELFDGQEIGDLLDELEISLTVEAESSETATT
ncbi:MAG: hypothetical protein ACR2H3_00225 [Acidimicrobiales bacterium]